MATVTVTTPPSVSQFHTTNEIILGSLPVAANEPSAGSVYQVKAFGTLNHTSTNNYEMAVGLKWAGSYIHA